MKTNSERKRERSHSITIYTVGLNHLQPEITRALNVEDDIIRLLHAKLSNYFKYSRLNEGESVGLISEGIEESYSAVKLNEYCRGIIDGYMFATEGMEVHGIIPSIGIIVRDAKDFPKGYTNNE